MPRSSSAAKEQERVERLERLKNSGLTAAKFWETEGVSLSSFYQWKRKLSAKSKPAPKSTRGTTAFAAIELKPTFFAVLCLLGWRVFWLTMVNRMNPNASAARVFTTTEISILEHLNEAAAPKGMPKLGGCLNAIAQLGGYLNRASDPPPSNNVLWRGISRLTDIHLGWEIHQRSVGN